LKKKFQAVRCKMDGRKLKPAHLPKRISLIDQTATVLRERLAQGEWSAHLPGEIELAGLLQVARNTVRAALVILEAEGLLKTTNGNRREVVLKRPCGRKTVRRAMLIMARPVHEFPPSTAQWIAAARMRLEGQGWQFQTLVEPLAYRGSPSALLKTLTQARPGAVWVLHRSTSQMQRWFQANESRVVLAGSRHEGINLPQAETDLRAASRHAAGRFLARGHSRLAVLRPEVALAGYDECVAAFRAGAGAADVTEVRHHGRPSDVVAALRRLLRSSAAPTGIYVLHPEHCVTALTLLQSHGIAVPGQMSLICLEDEAYLGLLCPEPTRYRRSAKSFATKLASLVEQCGKGMKPKQSQFFIMPSGIAGATLASAPVP